MDPDEDLAAFLQRFGVSGAAMERCLATLTDEDITTVALLLSGFDDIEAKLKVGPRSAIRTALFPDGQMSTEPLAPDESFPRDQGMAHAMHFMARLAPGSTAPGTRRHRRSLHRPSAGQSGLPALRQAAALAAVQSKLKKTGALLSEDSQGPWKIGSSVADIQPLEIESDQQSAQRQSKSIQNQGAQNQLELYEWRAKGYAYHSVSVKECVEWLQKINRQQNSEKEMQDYNESEGMPAINARDLRKCDPHFRSAADQTASQKPFFIVRQSTLVCVVGFLNISVAIRRHRALVFSPKTEEGKQQTVQMIRSLEYARVHTGYITAADDDESMAVAAKHVFGFQAFDAVLCEVNQGLHVRTQEVVLRLKDASRLEGEVANQEVRLCGAQLSDLSACANAVGEMLRVALETQLEACMQALGFNSMEHTSVETEQALLELEAVLEFHLNDLGEYSRSAK